MRETNTFQVRLDDFSSGIVTNVRNADYAGKGAEDIVNWIPGRQGELRKIPIGYYQARLASAIKRVVPFEADAATYHFVSLTDGSFYRIYQGDKTAVSFPSQVPMIGSTATTQPTVVKDYFVYDNKLHLLTGRKCNYVYVPGEGMKLWGQNGIIAPVDITSVGRYAYAASTAITAGTGILPSTSNGYYYRCTTAGDTAAEPTWPTTIGNTVSDGTVTWTCAGHAGDETQKKALRYRITHWDGRCESNPSPENGVPTTCAYGIAQVSVATGASNVEQIRVYRYDADTGQYRFVKGLDKDVLSISDSTTYNFLDPVSVNFLGEEIQLDNDPPPPAHIGTIYKNHAFLTGDTEHPSRLYFSKIANPFSYPQSNWIDIGGDDGDRIMALVPLADTLLVFKRNSLYAVGGEDAATWQVRYIADKGTVATRSAISIRGSVYFLSYDGFYRTTGSSVEKISYAIDNLFIKETEATLRDTTALHVPLVNSLYFNIYQDYEPNDGVTWILNLDTGAWTRTTMGVSDGRVVNGWTYFAKGTDYYVVTDSDYNTVSSELITKLQPLTDPVDYARIRRVSVSASNAQATTTLSVYYRYSEDADWTLLKTLTFSASNQTFRFSTNLHGNYLQFKVTHTGRMDRFNGLVLEGRKTRDRKLMTT